MKRLILPKALRILFAVLCILAICAALWYVFGRDGLQPVLMLGLFGGWTAVVGYYCFRAGLQSGYRQTMSLPPFESLFEKPDDPWKTLRETGDAEVETNEDEDDEQAGFEQVEQQLHNNF